MNSSPPERSRLSDIAWHALPLGAILSLQATDLVRGLSETEVTVRRAVQRRDRVLSRFRRSVTWPSIHLVIGSTLLIISVAMGYLHAWLACIIAAAFFFGGISTLSWREHRRRQARTLFRERHKWCTTVQRNGRSTTVMASELVPGDIISIQAGERVPADARLFEAESLSCQEIPLVEQGENQAKSAKPVATDTPLAKRSDMVFLGALVLSGRGRAIVVATGHDTALCALTRTLDEPPPAPSTPGGGRRQKGQTLLQLLNLANPLSDGLSRPRGRRR